MAAYAHVDVPGPLLPQLGHLLAEFEKDGRGKTLFYFLHFNMNNNLSLFCAGPRRAHGDVEVGQTAGQPCDTLMAKGEGCDFGENCHLWRDTTQEGPRAAPHVGGGNSLGGAEDGAAAPQLPGRSLAGSFANNYLCDSFFIYADKTRMLRAFFVNIRIF